MNISHLKYAVEVEKTRSITKAAENLYMGQPNLSRAIKELEESIGITIFKRTSKGVVPTELGAKFLGYARNILSQIEEIEALYNPSENNKVFLNISVPRAAYIAKAFYSFVSRVDKSKKIDINYLEANNTDTINNVLQNNFGIGIIRYESSEHNYYKNMLKEKDMDFKLISEFKYLILMSKNNPLAKHDAVSIDQLNNWVEICYDDNVASILLLKEYSKADKDKYRSLKRIQLYDMNNLLSVLGNVENTYAFSSPVPEDILSRYSLVQKRCKEANKTYQDVLIHRSCYIFNESERSFINELDNIISEIYSNS